jgi:monoterpene epsilon-lactone hydrolase
VPSPLHELLTWLIPVVQHRSEVRDPEQVRREVLAAQAASSDAPPRSVRVRCEVTSGERCGLPVVGLRAPGATPRRTVLYLHGGGFVAGPDRFHWWYAARLARRLGVEVVLPCYPLAPTHTWRDALPALVELFDELATGTPGAAEGVVVMGDSAGGGLAVLLAQSLAARPGPRPTHLVAFAPWVDLTGTTPGTEQAARRDPWLTLSKLRLYGTWWGGGEPPDPRASALGGPLGGLPETLVMCGTRDLLLPQSRELVRRARAAGTAVTYVEEPGLLHVYPLLPVPEAARAWLQVRDFLAGDVSDVGHQPV